MAAKNKAKPAQAPKKAVAGSLTKAKTLGEKSVAKEPSDAADYVSFEKRKHKPMPLSEMDITTLRALVGGEASHDRHDLENIFHAKVAYGQL